MYGWYVSAFEVQTTRDDKRPGSHRIDQNLSAAEEEASRIKSRKNLLLCTADELDGSGDPFYSTRVRQDIRPRRALPRIAGPQLSGLRISAIRYRGGHRYTGHI